MKYTTKEGAHPKVECDINSSIFIHKTIIWYSMMEIDLKAARYYIIPIKGILQ